MPKNRARHGAELATTEAHRYGTRVLHERAMQRWADLALVGDQGQVESDFAQFLADTHEALMKAATR